MFLHLKSMAILGLENNCKKNYFRRTVYFSKKVGWGVFLLSVLSLRNILSCEFIFTLPSDTVTRLFIWNMIWYLGTPQTLGRTKKGKLNTGSKCSEWICDVCVDLFLLLMKPVELPSMTSKVDDQGRRTGSLYCSRAPNHPSLAPTLHCSASSFSNHPCQSIQNGFLTYV